MTRLHVRCHIPSLVLLVGIGCVLVFTSSGRAQGPALPPELEKVRTALEKYRDPYVAVRDGYFSTVGCAYGIFKKGREFIRRPSASPASI